MTGARSNLWASEQRGLAQRHDPPAVISPAELTTADDARLVRDHGAGATMLSSITDSAHPAAPFDPELEAEFQAWLANDYLPIAGGWHY